MLKGRGFIVLLSIFSVFIVSDACAYIVDGQITGGTAMYGGTFTKIVPPSGYTVGRDRQQSNNLFAFDEDQNVTLNLDVLVNINTSGTSGIITSGTGISSHYVFFDPLRSTTLRGWVDFDSEILGIVTLKNTLDVTDHLSSLSVVYLSHYYRGLEDLYPDLAWINPSNPNRLNLSIRASSPGDYIRVITAESANSIPEPFSVFLFGAGFLGVLFKRQRRS